MPTQMRAPLEKSNQHRPKEQAPAQLLAARGSGFSDSRTETTQLKTLQARMAHSAPLPARPVVQAAAAGAVVQLVEDESRRPELDQRIVELKKETIFILDKMKVLGEDWEKQYALKGKEKGSNILSDKTDYKAELRNEALKKIWSNMTAEEKLELVAMGARGGSKALGAIVRGGLELVSASESKGKKKAEKEPEKRDKNPKDSSSGSLLRNLSQDDMSALYEAYSTLREVRKKYNAIKADIEKEAGKFGESAGATLGKLRDEADFNKRMKVLKQDFKVAQARLGFVKAAIAENKDSGRYQEELDALGFALTNWVFGPGKVYEIELNEAGRKQHPKLCEETIDYISASGPAIRSGLVAEARNFLGGVIDGIVGVDPKEKAAAQGSLATELERVIAKSWWNVTHWGWTPAGVDAIRTELPKHKEPIDKLTRSKALAITAKGEKSSNRSPITQIFYDAMANLDTGNIQSLNTTKSIITEISTKLS